VVLLLLFPTLVQAVASGVLDIAHSDVTEFPVAGVFLPDDTSVFDSLRSAVLSNNKLSTLPREFELCTALQVCTPRQSRTAIGHTMSRDSAGMPLRLWMQLSISCRAMLVALRAVCEPDSKQFQEHSQCACGAAAYHSRRGAPCHHCACC
jgi:hypothetical protein